MKIDSISKFTIDKNLKITTYPMTKFYLAATSWDNHDDIYIMLVRLWMCILVIQPDCISKDRTTQIMVVFVIRLNASM